VAARSKAWVCGRLPAEIVGSNPTEGHGHLSVVSVVLCCLCDELIILPEESYRLWCLVMFDLNLVIGGGPGPLGGVAPKIIK